MGILKRSLSPKLFLTVCLFIPALFMAALAQAVSNEELDQLFSLSLEELSKTEVVIASGRRLLLKKPLRWRRLLRPRI